MNKKQKKEHKLKKLWPYQYDDETTWPYLDCMLGESYGNISVKNWVKNPDFKYGHLIKGY
jgi:hypothetical protein